MGSDISDFSFAQESFGMSGMSPLSGKSRIIRYRQFTILLTYPKDRPVISECRSRKQIKTITPFRQPNGLSVTPHAVLRFLRTKRKFNISAGDRIG